MQVTIEDDKAILEVRRADKGDVGDYGVTVKNDLGEEAAQIPVSILGKEF